jgi:hypothetical protein
LLCIFPLRSHDDVNPTLAEGLFAKLEKDMGFGWGIDIKPG